MPSLSTYATGQHAASMDSLHGNGQFNEEGTAISLHCVEATQCSNQGAILPLITAGTFEAREIFEDPGECNSIVSQHSAAADTALHYQHNINTSTVPTHRMCFGSTARCSSLNSGLDDNSTRWLDCVTRRKILRYQRRYVHRYAGYTSQRVCCNFRPQPGVSRARRSSVISQAEYPTDVLLTKGA